MISKVEQQFEQTHLRPPIQYRLGTMRRLGLKSSSSVSHLVIADITLLRLLFHSMLTIVLQKSNSKAAKPVETRGSGSTSPTSNQIPIFERPVLSAQTLQELRAACALILQETGPSGQELEAIINQPDPLEVYKRDVAKVRAQASATQRSTFPAAKPVRQKEKAVKNAISSTNGSSAHLPLKAEMQPVLIPNAAHKSSTTLPLRQTNSDGRDPIKSAAHRHLKDRRSLQMNKDAVAPASLRASMKARPKTSAAACTDYSGPSIDSSAATTRSNTTHGNRISTGMTSFVQTPADEKRLSDHVPPRLSSRERAARSWTIEEGAHRGRERDLSTPNPDYAIPTLHHAHSRQSMRDCSRQSRQPSRPRSRSRSRSRSRTRSIKDNIFDGIRDYIQPRPSFDLNSRTQSRRSSQAGSCSSSRPASRGNTSSSKEWLKNAANGLRRRGSRSSFRSNREEDGKGGGRARDKGPDLNRSLPPLPGLDQYKEPKKHIGQLLARPKVQPQATVTKIEQPNPQVAPTSTQRDPAPSTVNAEQRPIAPPRPRIPFSDDHPKSIPYEATDRRSAALSPTEQRRRDLEARRLAHEKHRRSTAAVREQQPHRDSKREGTTALDEVFERRREQEIRRAVREKMLQGVLNGDEKHVRTDRLNSILRENDRNVNTNNGTTTAAVAAAPVVGIRDLTWEKEHQRRRKLGTNRKTKMVAREGKAAGEEPQKRASRASVGTHGEAKESRRMLGEGQGDAVRKRTLRNRISRLWGGNIERTSTVAAAN